MDDGPKKVESLLAAAVKSERFTLASKWFHCVRLGDDVLQEDHPQHLLFAGKNPARLLLSSADGSKIVRFLGTAQKKVKWSPIASILKKDYKKDPTRAVKALERLLSRWDALDDKRKSLNSQLEKATSKTQTAKVKALKKKLEKHEKERAEALEQQKKLLDLVLRSAAETKKKSKLG